ncbi:DUF1707 SHOCT-like domain-containing protein [Sediminivirga luteola]|uniref:DUF1707 domain-containing protein n=1 Tax=Sediminivirga luteola TaxID=1774748 RepID=A0A8J2XK39_9MICO|nr:DUF1707 domain-containing protein [Sediminivirga luteola]MCI2265334.1 DUF1707 domain-containing protein [Sediminivirga luteola]GGA24762.1 hypothetical protein GCM10011333_29740 [Sediminivirga luteola]
MREDDADQPPAPRPRGLRAGDTEREKVLTVLSDAHAAGRLTPEELDERQSAALAARYVAELPALIDDLPEGAALVPELERLSGIAPGRRGGRAAGKDGQALVPRPPVQPPVRQDGDARLRVAVLSGSEVVVAPGTPAVNSLALMGGDTLDLRSVLGPGVEFEVLCFAMWAGNEIIVPPGVEIVDKTVNMMAGNEFKITDSVRVDDQSVNLMAGNDISRRSTEDETQPGEQGRLVLKGFSLMAGHTISVQPR